MATYTVETGDLQSLHGKTLLVLGAATGIGHSVVELALDHGANVAIADWNEDARDIIRPYPTRALFHKCDVSSWDDVLDVFKAAHAKFGIIHTVISNAGINTHENLLDEELDPQTNRLRPPSLKSIEVNLIGQLYVSKCAIHYFAKWPAINCQLVLTSSAGAFFPAPPIYMYCAAKSGVLGLMRALRSEVVKRNVTVNTVAPWLTVTPMLLPEWLERWGDLPKNSPEGVARALLLPVVKPTLNGKSLFVAGNRIVEFEDALHQAEPAWMGQTLCEQVRRGQCLLLGLY